ncbi:MAG: serine hydrolase [Bacteroidales bacterium]|nr:serine hydrolase [Bacteroidales bacterium]
MINSFYQLAIALTSLILFNNLYIDSLELNRQFVPAVVEEPAFISGGGDWADSVMRTLSLERKIGQMIMIQVYSGDSPDKLEGVDEMIRQEGIGGILFSRGGPVRQAQLINRFQQKSKVPLIMAMDGEWGPGMRLDSTISYPRQMTLGAIQDNRLIYRMGYEIADQMKQLGIQMNFAPVADINSNPENPVINARSFGEDPDNVAEKVIAYFTGMQNNGLLVTAKHFPGHGDTDSDSHLTLPFVFHSRERLDSVELFPFRESVRKGITGIMVGHLHVPALDSRPGRPTSLSDKVIADLLVNRMGFKGLIVTDALSMKGVSGFLEPGELEVEAVLAGNDILLMPQDPHKAIQAIKKAVRKGLIPESRIDSSCRKILMAKHWSGLDKFEPIETKHLTERLNSRKYLLLQRKLVEEAIINLDDPKNLIPLKGLEKRKIATVSIGKEVPNAFTETVDLYMESSHFSLPSNPGSSLMDSLLKQMDGFNTVLVNIYGILPAAARQYGITERTLQFVESISTNRDVILNVAGTPYCLNRFKDLSGPDAVLLSCSEDELDQSIAAQAIFGGVACRGRIPVSAGSRYRAGSGKDTDGGIRLSYSIPEDAGMNYDTLLRIDSLVEDAIRQKATPGCQVLVARKGRVVWHKAYGYHTYQNRMEVKWNDLYDLASVTKIVATIPALMLLRGEGKFHEDSLLKTCLPEVDHNAKGDLIIRDILSHQAGLASWIPFYYRLLEPLDSSEQLISSKWSETYCYRLGNHTYANRNVKYLDDIFRTDFSPEYPIQVARDLYLRADFRDTVYRALLDSELGKKEYRYSDLGYYLLHLAIEHITDTLLYPYLYHNFYAPLGAVTLGYLPLNRFPEERIVPSENDMFFRRQLIRGFVHDPGAAMLGGISGHAGTFSNANDLAKMMQMYLNHGYYGGRHFLDSIVISAYTSRAYYDNGNRRALGFDRPVTEEKNAGPACDDASESSYGHSGFTGTIAWVDPEYDLVYIFLSNKVHPNQSNTKLIDGNIRTNIQQVLYDALEDD